MQKKKTKKKTKKKKKQCFSIKTDKAQHLLKLGTSVIKRALPAWKNIEHSNFFSTGRFFTHF